MYVSGNDPLVSRSSLLNYNLLRFYIKNKILTIQLNVEVLKNNDVV